MKVLQTSFSGGEISPELSGRIDLRQYASGASKLLNFLPLPQGPASRRPGSQYVASQYTSATHASQLIPFVYSTDQALCLEFIYGSGSGYVRIFDNGQPVQWSAPRNAGENAWDVVADSLTFLSEHGFTENEKIKLTVPMPIGGTGALPSPLDTGTDYWVAVVDSYTIKLQASESGGPINLSGSPSGYVRAFTSATFPATWISAASGQPGLKSCTSDVANKRWTCTGHAYVVGDVVRFTLISAGGASTNWRIGQNYYVTAVDTDWFQVSESRGGSSLDPNVDGVGGTVTRYYVQGEVVWWNGDGSVARNALHCKYDHAPDSPALHPPEPKWSVQPSSGELIVETPYDVAKVSTLHYAQSNDVMTLVHPLYAPMELRRFGDAFWDFRQIAFDGLQVRPSFRATDPVVATRGEAVQTYYSGSVNNTAGDIAWWTVGIPATGGSSGSFAAQKGRVAVGDTLVLGKKPASALEDVSVDTAYQVGYETDAVNGDQFQLLKLDGTWVTSQHSGGGVQWPEGDYVWYHSAPSADLDQSYVCTALSPSGVESIASDEVTISNNLDVPGASNLLYVNVAATGDANKFRIYKKQNGLFGLIGQINSTDPTITGWGHLGFTDDGIAPDMSISPPILDDSLSGTDYPRAVGYFEQRRCFGGTQENPRQLWMTKSGTESDMSYSLPVRDDDRISVSLAAREAATVQHIVPMADMLLLTQQGEWRVTAQNSDAITPETIAVRQQSEIGANDVQPIVVNNSVVYAANRGGHVRNMLYSQEVQGYATGDLSLRSSHLFDGLTIKDSAHSKAPYPVLWFVSSSGKLLSLTYVPEQEIAGWAVHDLSGTVESVCAIPEGNNDSLYVVVQRTVNGVTGRYVERIVPEVIESLFDSVYVDASKSYDGTESSGRTLTVTDGTTWKAGDSVKVTTSASRFKGLSDVGDVVELHDSAGAKYRVLITKYESSTVVTGTLQHDLPLSLRRATVATWAMARRQFSVGDHLEGVTVQTVSDGVAQDDQVVSGGTISLATPGVKVHVGRSYTSELRTLPLGMKNVDGFGQGRSKNVSKAYVRVLDTAGVTIGPDAERQVPVEGMQPSTLASGELRAVPDGLWSDGGEILIRQALPQPATVLGITLQVEIGD